MVILMSVDAYGGARPAPTQFARSAKRTGQTTPDLRRRRRSFVGAPPWECRYLWEGFAN